MREFYCTIAEASEAAVRLGISSSHEYSRRYREDTKLHSVPSTKYSKDWRGWSEFLCRKPKIYSTLSEASLAVIRLGITNCREYRSRYSEDPRLPSSPQRLFSSDWVNWYEFFGKKKQITTQLFMKL